MLVLNHLTVGTVDVFGTNVVQYWLSSSVLLSLRRILLGRFRVASSRPLRVIDYVSSAGGLPSVVPLQVRVLHRVVLGVAVGIVVLATVGNFQPRGVVYSRIVAVGIRVDHWLLAVLLSLFQIPFEDVKRSIVLTAHLVLKRLGFGWDHTFPNYFRLLVLDLNLGR